MPPKPKDEGKLDRQAFAETERDSVAPADVEAAVRQVMQHPAKPDRKSENREPTKAELQQRWKLERVG